MDALRTADHHGAMFNRSKEFTMSLISYLTSPAGLRRVLWADAVSGAGMAALHLGFAPQLQAWLGYPAGWLSASAWALVAYVLLAGTLAVQARPAAAAVRLLALGNFAWVAGSVALVLSGVGEPTVWGMAYVLGQAVAVLVLAELQWMATRQPAARPAH